MNCIYKWIILIVLLCWNMTCISYAEVPLRVTLEVRLATDTGGFLPNNKKYDVDICVVEGEQDSCLIQS